MTNQAAVLALCSGLSSGVAFSVHAKDPSAGLDAREFSKPELYISSTNAPLEDVLSQLKNREAWETRLARGREDSVRAFIDTRTGAVSNLLESVPLVPGRGEGNRLRGKADAAAVEAAFRAHLGARREVLGIDLAQLGKARVVQVDHLWQITIPQTADSVLVRDARLMATLNHGNLVLLGTEYWSDVRGLNTRPTLSASQALDAGFGYADGRRPEDVMIRAPRLEIVPIAPQDLQVGEGYGGPIGDGIRHRLAWSFVFQRAPQESRWEVLVDAHDGEILAFRDNNQYARKSIQGGVYPLTNTEICPNPDQCGVMQSNWPMPFADTGFPSPENFANSHGTYNYTSGTATTTLSGRYVNIADACGGISNSSSNGRINMGGVNGQHDCVSGGGSPGNTPASRTVFYEVNKLAELARGYLPGNAWLNATLTANVNLASTCNAFWD